MDQEQQRYMAAAHAARRERHTDQLPTKEARDEFLDKVLPLLHATRRATSTAIAALKDNPGMLAYAFGPNITSIAPGVVGKALFELYISPDSDRSSVIVQVSACVGPKSLNEVAVRIQCNPDGTYTVREDAAL